MRLTAQSNKIALFFTGFAGGGAERVMIHLAEGLSERGNTVDLVVCNGRGPLRNEVPESVRLVNLGAPRIIASLPGLVRYLRRERPGVMLSAMASANCVAILARALARVPLRMVLSEHNMPSLASAHGATLRARLMPKLMRWTYPAADCLVAVSYGVADDLSKIIELPRNRIEVIYNPVVTKRLNTLKEYPLNHSWFGPEQPPVVVATGRLTYQKDFSSLIHAFALVRQNMEVRLMILGEGHDRRDLEDIVTKLGIEADVAMPGFVKNPYPYMRESAVFVLTSLTEGFGNALVEAMACGAPVVSTDCPSGPSEILEGGKWGALVPVGDVVGLSEAIMLALGKGRGGEEARRKRAGEFSADVAVDRYLTALIPGIGAMEKSEQV